MTPRQQEVLGAMRRYIREHGIAPTIQDIAEAMGLTKTSVHEHLVTLERDGHLKRVPDRKTRGLIPARDEAIDRASVIDVVKQAFAGKAAADPIGTLQSHIVRGIEELPAVST